MKRHLCFRGFKEVAFAAPLVLALLSWTGLASAQGAPNDYQIGFPPHADFSGTDFENYQVNNGNLHIEVPLWSTAGRGPSVGFKYVYDSLGWGFDETCDRITGFCTDHVTPNPGKAGVVANHLRFTLVGPQSWKTGGTQQTYSCSGMQVYIHSSSAEAPDGTHHHFLPDPYETNDQVAYCFPHPNTLYADDGSGWIFQVNTGKLVRKDGTSFFLSTPTTTEDTNGNEVTASTTSGTDTLGRQFNTDGSYYDSNNVLHTIPVTYGTVAVNTNLCWASPGDSCSEYSSSGWTVVTSITLPNGMSYTFTYGKSQCGLTGSYYGQPCSVTLPTGGTITWGWQGDQDTGPHLVSRQLSGDPGPWTYPGVSGVGPSVIDPAGNETVYTGGMYTPPGAPIGGTPIFYVIKKQYYQGSHTSGTLLKTIQTDYWQTNGRGTVAILPIHETTTWNQQNLVSRTETDYDSYSAGGGPTVSAGNPIETREYAFGSGTWGAQIRTTDRTYLHLSNSNYLNANILDRVTSKKVYAGSQTGTLVAQTLNTYDGVAIAGNTSGNQAPNHDYTNFSASYNIRGNLTQASRGLKSSSGTWSWLNTNNTYNDLGELLTSTDPLSHQTSYDYTDNWVSISNQCTPSGQQTYAFPTTITDPLGHRTKHTYYSCTSLLGSTQDENDIAAARPGTTYNYDLMDRITAEYLPDGGQTTYSYNDTVPYSRTSSELIKSGMSKVSTIVHDGLGRVQQSQLVDPDCSSGPVKVDYTYSYDPSPPTGTPAGRFTTVSNPYCTTSDPTYGITKNRYDALDRPVLVIPPDGSDSANNESTSYAANIVTVTDQTGRQRKRQTDALGRLTYAWEDPSGLNYETDYSYDVLDNLTTVTQKGGATSSSWRTRSFTYDSLSRLTCAANPEITPGLSTISPASCPATYTGTYTNGTIGYSYDADSNLTTRTAPAPNQTSTSSTVTTTYSYDKDNRLTQKSYTGNPATVTVRYGYDGSALSGCTTTPPTPTTADANPIGNRTSMCDGSGATSWTHDPMGRTLIEQRIINGTSPFNKNLQYAYYLNGELKTLTYPAGRVVTYTPNSAGRSISAVDSGQNWITGASYAPSGAMSSITYNGGSVYGAFTYNSRLQPMQIAFNAGSQPSNTGTSCPPSVSAASIMQRLYDFHLGSGNNGNVWVINNCKDTNRTQNFLYDSFNRISQAYTTGNSPLLTSWGETFGPTATNPGVQPTAPGIDAWGNLTNRSGVIGKTNTEPLNAAPASVKNQLNGFCNDAAGNLVLNAACPTGTFTPTFSYDIDNRLTSAAAGYSYVYDGDSQRVKKCSNSGCTTGTLYWTGTGNEALAEFSVSGGATNQYIFFNGKRVARHDASTGDYYYFSDHLGSTDVITDNLGSVKEESDYYPYGGELVVSGSNTNRYKFNGKERDGESGLDNFGARYDSSSLGRFMTPDWAARPTAVPYAVFGDPQSLNLYGYVRNDPVSVADADGHQGVERDAFHSDQPCGISNVCLGTGDGISAGLFGKDQPSWQIAAFQQRQEQARTQNNQKATLNVSLKPGATNNSGLHFPSGGTDIGPAPSEGRGWFYNALLKGTLPAGADASKYGIVQTYNDKTSGKTEDGKSFVATSKDKETLAPNGQWSTTKGNTIYAVDSPGPHNSVNGQFVDSVSTNIQFKSWVVDQNGKQVSPAVNWSVKIIVVGGQLQSATAGLR